MVKERLPYPDPKKMKRFNRHVYRDGEDVWRILPFDVETFNNGVNELAVLADPNKYNIPNALVELVHLPIKSREVQKTVAKCNYINGLSLEVLLNSESFEIGELGGLVAARDLLNLYVEHLSELIRALDYYWASTLQYQLDQCRNGKRFLNDIEPFDQAIFALKGEHKGKLVIVDVDPQFYLNKENKSPPDVMAGHFKYFVQSEVDEGRLTTALTYLKELVPDIIIDDFPLAPGVVQSILDFADLNVPNPFEVALAIK